MFVCCLTNFEQVYHIILMLFLTQKNLKNCCPFSINAKRSGKLGDKPLLGQNNNVCYLKLYQKVYGEASDVRMLSYKLRTGVSYYSNAFSNPENWV